MIILSAILGIELELRLRFSNWAVIYDFKTKTKF